MQQCIWVNTQQKYLKQRFMVIFLSTINNIYLKKYNKTMNLPL